MGIITKKTKPRVYRIYTLTEKVKHINKVQKSNAPRSTSYNWSNTNKEMLLEQARQEGVLEIIEESKQILQHSCNSILHTLDFFMNTVNKSKSLKKYYKNNRVELIVMIDKLKSLVSIDELLFTFGMNRKTYTSLKNKLTCHLSLSKNCLNSTTNQIHNDMVVDLKDFYFHNPKYEDYSLSDLFAEVIHDRRIFISQTKFREIAVALGEDVKRKRILKKEVYKSLESFTPNQYIQADKTAYKLSNGVKAWIYLVIDHYSRKILAAHVSFSSKSIESLTTLNVAIKNNNLSEVNFTYMTDAGSENKGRIKEFIGLQKHIKHVIAQTTQMNYSNSMVESIIKYFKREILKRKSFKTIEELIVAVSEGVLTYNNRRRVFLDGATPNEFYNGNEPDMIEYDSLYKQDMQRRANVNREFDCMKPCQISILKPKLEFG